MNKRVEYIHQSPLRSTQALGNPLCTRTGYLLCGADVDEGSLGGIGVRAVAQTELCVHGIPQLLNEAVVDPTLDQEAVGAHTRLRMESEGMPGNRNRKWGGKRKSIRDHSVLSPRLWESMSFILY